MRLCAVVWGKTKNMHGHVYKLLLNIIIVRVAFNHSLLFHTNFVSRLAG